MLYTIYYIFGGSSADLGTSYRESISAKYILEEVNCTYIRTLLACPTGELADGGLPLNRTGYHPYYKQTEKCQKSFQCSFHHPKLTRTFQTY